VTVEQPRLAGDPRRSVANGHHGRLVPAYAVTAGRTRSSGPELPVESLVTATGRWAGDLEKEYRMIIELAAGPVSLVEVGATLSVPFGVARVLVSDLAEAGYLDVHTPPPGTAEGRPAPEHLVRLLEGLRAR
jgi:Protein of unknown function (DUF742)